MTTLHTEDQWVVDDAKTRGFDGKRLLIKGRGVFLMHCREISSKGERRPGFVQLIVTPYDLNAAMSLEDKPAICP